MYTYSSLLGLWFSLVSAFCLSLAVAGIPFNGFWGRRTLIDLLRECREVNFIVIGTAELDFETDRPQRWSRGRRWR
jgi:hypothetical protein